MIRLDIAKRTLEEELAKLKVVQPQSGAEWYRREGAIEALEWLLKGSEAPSEKLSVAHAG